MPDNTLEAVYQGAISVDEALSWDLGEQESKHIYLRGTRGKGQLLKGIW